VVVEVVDRLDRQDRIVRSQSFRDVALVGEDYVELAFWLIKNEETLKNFGQVNQRIVQLHDWRWCHWHLHLGHQNKLVSDEAGTFFPMGLGLVYTDSRAHSFLPSQSTKWPPSK
jgi:hypothetical protein